MASNDGAHDAPVVPVAQRPRRRWPWVAALVLAAIPVLAVLILALVEFRIPLDFLRERIEQAAGDASGLELRLEGPVYLVTGPRPGVESHAVAISAPSGGKSLELLRVGLSRGEIALGALLRREVHVTRAQAQDVAVRLDAAAFAAIAGAERHAKPRSQAPISNAWRFVGASRIEIVRARGEIRLPALARPMRIDVDTLTLRAEASEPLTVEARGSLAGEAMQVDFRAASLDALRAGKRRIPLELHFTLADASLKGHGTIDVEAQRGEYQLAAKGSGRFIERVLPGFQSALGELQVVTVEGRLRTAPDETALESLTVSAGRTRAQGELRQRVADGRLRFEGRLDFEVLDLRPWLPLIEAREQARPSADDPLDAIRSVQSKADIEIGLKVEKLIWPQREAQGVSATLNVGADAVAARGAAQLLVGAIEGNARLETAQAEARLRVDAQADQIVLEALHPEVERAGVSGMVRSAKLALRGAGANMTVLRRSLEGELDLHKVEAKWRRENKGAATQIKIDTAQLAATRDALHGTFHAVIDDATLVLQLASERAAVESTQRVVKSTFDLRMRRARRRGVQFDARGDVTLDKDHWMVDAKDLRLGKSRGHATAKGSWTDESPLALSAAFARFDAATLEFFDFESARRRAQPVSWEETTVLPSALELPAADFELSTDRFEAAAVQFDKVRVAGRSREGRLEQTRFELEAKGGALRGELSADLRGKLPRLQGRVTGTDFDARGLLQRFDVKLERARVKRLEAKLDLRGARLKEVVARSMLQVSAQGVDATLPGLLDARRKLAFEGKLDADSTQGQILVGADGTLNGKPFRATSRGPQLATLIGGAERVPVDIDLSVADNTLGVHGVVAKGPQADVDIRLAAKHANELVALGGLESNARGSLAASVQLKLTPPARYAFEQLDVRLGESALSGRVIADWSAARPSVEAKLAGPVLRLRDLGVDASAAEAGPAAAVEADVEAAEPAWIDSLRALDASLDLKVERVFAAGELLGSLRAQARLKGGRLHVGPLVLREGNSVLNTEGEVDAAAPTPEYVVEANLRNYDITPLLRSFKLSSQGTATFDARTALRSRGFGADVVSNLSGVFDASSYGSGVGSGSVELMGINLLGLVMNTLDQSRQSKINCAVGVFDIDKGVMKSRALFVDTTLLRIMGNLDVDLVAETLDGGLRPSPKNPRLFNVSTPIGISGTLQEPKVSIATSALPELLIRYSNPYTIFLGALMDTENAKADGSDDCRAAYAKADSARPELGEARRSLFRFLP